MKMNTKHLVNYFVGTVFPIHKQASNSNVIITKLQNIHLNSISSFDGQCIQENGSYRDKKEGLDDPRKDRERSESDNSWSSVDDIDSKEMADKSMEEDDNLEKIEEETEEQRCNQLRRKSKTIRKPDVPQDCKEAAQRRPLLASSS